MLPETDEATPISDEELAVSAVEPARPPRVSSPPPLPPQARRPGGGDGTSSAVTPPPPAGPGSVAPPAPLPGSVAPPTRAVQRPTSSQSGTWRISDRALGMARPPLPPPGRTNASPPQPPGAAAAPDPALLRMELADARAQIARLRLQLCQRDDRIAELERKHAELEQAARGRGERIEQLERELVEARARTVAPPDDLKQIPGIGPAFERALHALGVSSFADIAAWTTEDVCAMAARLNTPERRILRDGWVENARRLAAERAG